MKESMKTVLSNQVFENKKRKQNKKELFLIIVVIGTIVLVSLIVALVIILSQEPGIKAFPFVLVAGVLGIIGLIIFWIKSDAKTTFREVTDATEEEIKELARKQLKDNEAFLEKKPEELKRIELSFEEKVVKYKEGITSLEEKIKELKEILNIPA